MFPHHYNFLRLSCYSRKSEARGGLTERRTGATLNAGKSIINVDTGPTYKLFIGSRQRISVSELIRLRIDCTDDVVTLIARLCKYCKVGWKMNALKQRSNGRYLIELMRHSAIFSLYTAIAV